VEPRVSEHNDEPREHLQQALAGAYEIERELGRGGMATVYLAHDRKHDRPVALKVLHPDLGAALGPERFQREIRLAARLQHPHILPVFDSGDADGRLWYTMPYVEGESLRDRLERERQLPVEVAVRIVREAAQGLHYAHRHGVIHRDVKPENILLTEDGTTLVADFGIARAMAGSAVAGPGGMTQLTGTGLAIGTPAYMSPEQGAGERDVDARSDVYSLGAVLYELLAGEPPFTGTTPQAILAKRFVTPAPSIRVVRPGVSAELEAALARALATAAADRFNTAIDFSTALGYTSVGMSAAAPATTGAEIKIGRRRVLVGIAAILLMFVGAATWWLRGRSEAPVSVPMSEASLAVLPFENLGDSADAYFADGVTDEVRGKLAAIRHLRVIASASSRQYRGTTKSPAVIARDLGVRYLLLGRVRWQKSSSTTSRVRVDPELVDVNAGPAPRTTWQQPFDAELSDVFRVQTEIAERVANELRVALATEERSELATVPTGSLDAYDAFLRGRELVTTNGLDPTSLRRAVAAFREAVTRDPNFVRAWTALANTYVILAVQPAGSPIYGDSARVALEQARALGMGQPGVQVSAAAYEGFVLGRWDRALATATDALAQSPNDVRLLNTLALAEEALGQWNAAAAHWRRAVDLDPRSIAFTEHLGRMARLRHHLPEAQAALDHVLSLQPADADGRVLRAMVDLDAGDVGRARAVLRNLPTGIGSTALLANVGEWGLSWLLDDAAQQRILALEPASFAGSRASWGLALADAYALRGDSAKARVYADSAHAELRSAATGKPNDAERWAWAALGSAYAGYKGEALQAAEHALERAVKNRRTEQTVHDYVVRTFIVAGERERALKQLEAIPRGPAALSPAWLRVDPHYAALRGEPRFQRLTAAR
jgi:eukaryotic-like serine/threonine-protein kinase